MLIRPNIFCDARGSFDGVTAARNRGGLYLRERATPTDPMSPAQLEARQAVTNAAGLWPSLTSDEQQSWIDYGRRIVFSNALGDGITLSGQMIFNRSAVAVEYVNIFEGAVVLSVPNLAPAGSTLPQFSVSPRLVNAVVATQLIRVMFDPGGAWRSEDGACVMISQGLPQGMGINFFKGPWRRAVNVFGNSTTPPGPVVTFPAVFPFTAPERMWILFRLYRADGGYGNDLVEGPLETSP
ncbi:MAG: hypothetical protein ACE5LB_13005 [Acidiferrobacterales bacterium]